jgi:hypothetical protein
MNQHGIDSEELKTLAFSKEHSNQTERSTKRNQENHSFDSNRLQTTPPLSDPDKLRFITQSTSIQFQLPLHLLL